MHVFAGPTLTRRDVEGREGFTWHPPAAQGDIFRLLESRHPYSIGIVDGYFAGQPSVLHKEILWAMASGTVVFGAASMGALRAAELHSFGMRGIGDIFTRYRDGLIEDDDEVAVVHGPAELDFVSLTTPMVNIRATLDKAMADGVISAETGSFLTTAAKQAFYADRCWRTLGETARSHGLPKAELARFGSWLEQGELNVKRDDALAMLEAMTLCRRQGEAQTVDKTRFEWTQAWDDLVTSSDRSPAGGGASCAESGGVLDELRLHPPAYRRLRERAALKWLVSRDPTTHESRSSSDPPRRRITEFRRAKGLLSYSDFKDFLRSRALTESAVTEHLSADEQTESVLNQHAAAVEQCMSAMLRLGVDFDALSSRAAAKRRWHERNVQRIHSDSGPLPALLLAWYFGDVLEEPIPEDLDGFLNCIGLPDRRAFYRLLKIEYLFRSDEAAAVQLKEK